MSERELEEWGGYKPETQKALRFVALHDKAAAKQIASAIVKEYATPIQPKPTSKPAKQPQTLTENDLIVLKLASMYNNLDIEKAIEWSRLNEDQFFQSVATLKRQKYLKGDIFFGYIRTKKPAPSDEDIQFDQRCKQIIKEKVPGWTL